MNPYLTCILMPVVAAGRFGCGAGCAAPVCVFWLFGVFSIIFSLFGGPTGVAGISWTTLAIGVSSWCLAAIWGLVLMITANGQHCDIEIDQQAMNGDAGSP